MAGPAVARQAPKRKKGRRKSGGFAQLAPGRSRTGEAGSRLDLRYGTDRGHGTSGFEHFDHLVGNRRAPETESPYDCRILGPARRERNDIAVLFTRGLHDFSKSIDSLVQ